mmetsp:Transcript_7065/g.28699  ORF Transcript_7065/g.28699 Transcript_7065/m.28699 type:complete len:582 (-) Transcript_7065:145-1890(-)
MRRSHKMRRIFAGKSSLVSTPVSHVLLHHPPRLLLRSLQLLLVQRHGVRLVHQLIQLLRRARQRHLIVRYRVAPLQSPVAADEVLCFVAIPIHALLRQRLRAPPKLIPVPVLATVLITLLRGGEIGAHAPVGILEVAPRLPVLEFPLGLRVVLEDLPVEETPHLLLRELLRLERVLRPGDDLRRGLPAGIRQTREVRVRESLLGGGPVLRVKRQHPLQQRQRRRRRAGKPGAERDPGFDAHVPEKPPGLLVPHLVDHVRVRGAQQVGDDLQLVNHVLAREQRSAAQDLGEDAADAPYVDRGGVLREEAPAQLRGAVPPGGDVVRPEHGRRSAVVKRRSRQAEVANLELAIRVGQDVLGLQVPVVHVRGVNVLEPSQQLVEEELVVLVRQVVVRLDDLVEVRLHELEDDEDVLELPRVGREHDVLHLHDVGMLQHAEELHLSQDPGRIRHVLEDVGDLLDGHLLPGLVVRRRAHHPVASLADDLVDGETVSLAVLGEEALVVHRRGRRHFVQPPPFVTAVSSKAGWSERPLRLELDRVRRSVARPKGFAHSRLCARPRTRSEPARMPSPARSRPPKGSTRWR